MAGCFIPAMSSRITGDGYEMKIDERFLIETPIMRKRAAQLANEFATAVQQRMRTADA